MPPSGIVTFLFTDIEGSTPLWERDPAAMRQSLNQHNQIMTASVREHGGHVFQTVGDAFQAAFEDPAQGVATAVAAQRGLAAAGWGETGALRVRMGLHRGPAETGGDDYLSSHTLNRAARVMSAGHGEQILLSLDVAEAVRDRLPPEVTLRDLGEYRLKGLSRTEHLFQAIVPGLRTYFPPLNGMQIQPSALDQLQRGKLIARNRELQEAVASWRRTVAGQGQALLISGEPGIGKTRLVRELTAQVRSSGGYVLVGECYAESSAPYAPVTQMILAATTLADFDPLARQPSVVLADLIALAPMLRARYPDIPPNPSLEPLAEQQRLFESVVALCRALTDRAPLLVVLDDAHWADRGTLFLLRHVARRMRHAPLLMVLTYREIELDQERPLNAVLLDLSREQLATRIKLARLTPDQTRELLSALFAEDITPEFLEGIYGETEGNPFFVEEVCKTLIESGKLYYTDGRWNRPDMSELEIPQSVRVAIQARVNQLPESAQETLRLAAILGREFRYDVLALAGERDEDALIADLESAERAQLIAEVRGARDVSFAFAHALIFVTLVESVSTLRRRRLHQRAATALEALRPDDDAALAHHFAAAGDRGKAVTFAQRAARSATAVYAYDIAKGQLIAALNQLDATEKGETRLALVEDLADVQCQLGEFDDAIPMYLEALELRQTLSGTDELIAVRLHRKLLEIVERVPYAEFKRFEAVFRSSMQAGRRLADETPHPEVVRLLAALSTAESLIEIPLHGDAPAQHARAAVEMAEQLDAPVELAIALEQLLVVYAGKGLFRERIQVALRLLSIIHTEGFTDSYERARILASAGAAFMQVGEYSEALPYLQQAEDLAAQVHGADPQVAALRHQARCWFALDRWEEVLKIEKKLRALKERYPNLLNRVGAYCFMVAIIASAHARRGELQEARILRDEAMEIMTTTNGPAERWDRSNRY